MIAIAVRCTCSEVLSAYVYDVELITGDLGRSQATYTGELGSEYYLTDITRGPTVEKVTLLTYCTSTIIDFKIH